MDLLTREISRLTGENRELSDPFLAPGMLDRFLDMPSDNPDVLTLKEKILRQRTPGESIGGAPLGSVLTHSRAPVSALPGNALNSLADNIDNLMSSPGSVADIREALHQVEQAQVEAGSIREMGRVVNAVIIEDSAYYLVRYHTVTELGFCRKTFDGNFIFDLHLIIPPEQIELFMKLMNRVHVTKKYAEVEKLHALATSLAHDEELEQKIFSPSELAWHPSSFLHMDEISFHAWFEAQDRFIYLPQDPNLWAMIGYIARTTQETVLSDGKLLLTITLDSGHSLRLYDFNGLTLLVTDAEEEGKECYACLDQAERTAILSLVTGKNSCQLDSTVRLTIHNTKKKTAQKLAQLLNPYLYSGMNTLLTKDTIPLRHGDLRVEKTGETYRLHFSADPFHLEQYGYAAPSEQTPEAPSAVSPEEKEQARLRRLIPDLALDTHKGFRDYTEDPLGPNPGVFTINGKPFIFLCSPTEPDLFTIYITLGPFGRPVHIDGPINDSPERDYFSQQIKTVVGSATERGFTVEDLRFEHGSPVPWPMLALILRAPEIHDGKPFNIDLDITDETPDFKMSHDKLHHVDNDVLLMKNGDKLQLRYAIPELHRYALTHGLDNEASTRIDPTEQEMSASAIELKRLEQLAALSRSVIKLNDLSANRGQPILIELSGTSVQIGQAMKPAASAPIPVWVSVALPDWKPAKINEPLPQLRDLLRKKYSGRRLITFAFGRKDAEPQTYTLQGQPKVFELVPETLSTKESGALSNRLTLNKGTLVIPAGSDLHDWLGVMRGLLLSSTSKTTETGAALLIKGHQTDFNPEGLMAKIIELWEPFNQAQAVKYFGNRRWQIQLEINYESLDEAIKLFQETVQLYQASMKFPENAAYQRDWQAGPASAEQSEPSASTNNDTAQATDKPDQTEASGAGGKAGEPSAGNGDYESKRTLIAILPDGIDPEKSPYLGITITEFFEAGALVLVSLDDVIVRGSSWEPAKPNGLKLTLDGARFLLDGVFDPTKLPVNLAITHQTQQARGREAFTASTHPQRSDGPELEVRDYVWTPSDPTLHTIKPKILLDSNVAVTDVFELEIELTQNPDEPKPSLTGIAIELAESIRSALGNYLEEHIAEPRLIVIEDQKHRTTFDPNDLTQKLNHEFLDTTTVTFIYSDFPNLQFVLKRLEDKTISATRLPLDHIVDMDGPYHDRDLTLSTDKLDDLLISLEPVARSRIPHPHSPDLRYILPQKAIPTVVAWLRLVGHEIYFDDKTQTDIEVSVLSHTNEWGQRVRTVGFEAFTRNPDGSIPHRSTMISSAEHSALVAALDEQIRERGTSSNLDFSLLFQPPIFANLMNWGIEAKEVFLPTPETLNLLRDAFFSSKDSLENRAPYHEGDRLWYEFENDRGLVISVPVVWKNRRRNPFGLDVGGEYHEADGKIIVDSGRFIKTHLRGHRDQTERILPHRWRAHDMGGYWKIYPVEVGHGLHVKAGINLSLIISPYSPILLGLVNTLDEHGTEAEKQETRAQASAEIHRHLIQYFQGGLATLPPIYIPNQRMISVEQGKPIALHFYSEDQDGHYQASLEGISFRRDRSRLDYSDRLQLSLTTTAHKGTPITETLTLTSHATEHPSVVLLKEINTARLKPRQFLWSHRAKVLQEILEQTTITEATADVVEAYIKRFHWPVPTGPNVNGEGNYGTLQVRYRHGKSLLMPENIPLLPETERSFLIPELSEIEIVTDLAKVDAIMQGLPLHQAVFQPTEETLFAQTLIGREEEFNTFVTRDGVLLQILFTNERTEERERYIINQTADSPYGTVGARLLIPIPSDQRSGGKKYFQIHPSVFHPKRLNTGAHPNDLMELQVIGTSDWDFTLHQVAVKAFSQYHGFGFLAEQKGLTLGPRDKAQARAVMAEWLNYLHLHAEPVPGVLPTSFEAPFTPEGAGFKIESAEGIFTWLGLEEVTDHEGRTHIYVNVIDKLDSALQLEVSRAHGDGALFYFYHAKTKTTYYFVVDESGTYWIWRRKTHSKDFLAPPSSVRYPMTRIDGGFYQSESLSIASRRPVTDTATGQTRFEILLGLGREQDATDLALIQDSASELARIRVQVYVDEQGNLQIERGTQLDSEVEAYFPWQADYEIDIVEDQWTDLNSTHHRGEIKIFFRNLKLPGETNKNIQPYGWASFKNREALIGPAEKFTVHEAHYHVAKREGRKLMPNASRPKDRVGFLTKRAGVNVDLSEVRQKQFATLKEKAIWQQLSQTSARQEDIPILMLGLGALNLIDNYEKDGPDWLRSLAAYCMLENPLYTIEDVLHPFDRKRYQRRETEPASSGPAGGPVGGSRPAPKPGYSTKTLKTPPLNQSRSQEPLQKLHDQAQKPALRMGDQIPTARIAQRVTSAPLPHTTPAPINHPNIGPKRFVHFSKPRLTPLGQHRIHLHKIPRVI